MRQAEAVVQIHFTGSLALGQSAQKILPIRNPGIGAKRLSNLPPAFFTRTGGETEQNVLLEQGPPDSNHIALPLQRSLAPRISAKVRFFGKIRGSFSVAGRTTTASPEESCTDS